MVQEHEHRQASKVDDDSVETPLVGAAAQHRVRGIARLTGTITWRTGWMMTSLLVMFASPSAVVSRNEMRRPAKVIDDKAFITRGRRDQIDQSIST